MNANAKKGSGLLIVGGILTIAIVVGMVILPGQSKSDGAGKDSADGMTLPKGFGSVPPDAMFIERSGKQMALKDLRGKPWIASFIFTRCQGTCPMMTKSLGELQDDLRTVGDVRLVSFTVDPEYDTPERLQEYAAQYKADQNRWLFLQGSDSSVQELAKNTFHVGIAEGTSKEEPIIHSSRFFMVDSNGEIRGLYDGRTEDGKKKLLSDLSLLIKEEENKGGN